MRNIGYFLCTSPYFDSPCPLQQLQKYFQLRMINGRLKNEIIVQIRKHSNYQRNFKKISDRINFIPQVSLNVQNSQQNFYKTVVKTSSHNLLLVHGYKLLELNSFEEDILLYCLSLLQTESEFPVKANIKRKCKEKHELDIEIQKTLWLQTQFIMSSSTMEQQQQIKSKNKELQIYKFFNQFLIPVVRKFKQQYITWDIINSDQFQYSQLVYNFRLHVIRQSNLEFQALQNKSLSF